MAWHTIDPDKLPRKIQFTTKQRYALIIAGLVIGGMLAGVSAAVLLPQPLAQPPKHVVEKMLFPLYMPSKLPPGYSVQRSSFQDVEGALLFRVTSPDGKKLSFSEQPRMKDFNFTNFYKGQLPEAKNIPQVPYQTVFGKGPDGWLVSILTDDTWILISSKQEITESDARIIVRGLMRI